MKQSCFSASIRARWGNGSWQCKSCSGSRSQRWQFQSLNYFEPILSTVPKVWLCWLIFAIKIGCAPLNLIFGGLFYHDSTEEPHLPPLMIAGGLFEVIRQNKMFDSAPQFSAICVCLIISGYRSWFARENMLAIIIIFRPLCIIFSFARYLGSFSCSTFMSCFRSRWD